MERDGISNSLLKRLLGLYSDVVLLIFKKRIESYRRTSHADDGSGVHRTLSSKIEKFAAADKGNGTETMNTHPIADIRESESDKKHHSIIILFKMWTSLGSYFRKSPRGSLSHNHMGTKMKESVWDHVHAALRLARQGKIEQARFHADIANNALKEVGHYMAEDEFRSFSSEIEVSLKKI